MFAVFLCKKKCREEASWSVAEWNKLYVSTFLWFAFLSNIAFLWGKSRLANAIDKSDYIGMKIYFCRRFHTNRELSVFVVFARWSGICARVCVKMHVSVRVFSSCLFFFRSFYSGTGATLPGDCVTVILQKR